MTDLVLTEVAGSVATLTLNRPERHNSLVPELLHGILAGLDDLREEPALRALVLQANGRSFSTGGDVRAFWQHKDDVEAYAEEIVGRLNQVILALIDFPVPVVAAVHGIVTGGSLGLVLASDVVLVAPEATFTPYYATVGFSPDGGWTALLPHVIGQKRAAGVLLRDQTITAEQAVEWSIALRIVPAGDIRREARTAARSIAEQKAGSVAHTKRLLWADRNAIAARLEEERRHFVQQITTDEARQGMQAFLEKRL